MQERGEKRERSKRRYALRMTSINRTRRGERTRRGSKNHVPDEAREKAGNETHKTGVGGESEKEKKRTPLRYKKKIKQKACTFADHKVAKGI